MACGCHTVVGGGVLQTWQKAHATSAVADLASADPKKKGQDGVKGQVEQQQRRQEFGADLEFHFLRVGPTPDEARLDEHASHAGDAPGSR